MVGYRFLGGSDNVDAKVESNILNLNSLSEEQLDEFSSLALESLSDQSLLNERVQAFAEEQGVKAKALMNLATSLQTVLRGAVLYNVSGSALQEDLMLLGLTESTAAQICSTWQQHYVSLNTKAALSTLKTNRLLDMEWNFGVAVASDTSSNLGTTFLHLQLVIDEAGARRKVNMELTLSDFYVFLREMEKAQNRMAVMLS